MISPQQSFFEEVLINEQQDNQSPQKNSIRHEDMVQHEDSDYSASILSSETMPDLSDIMDEALERPLVIDVANILQQGLDVGNIIREGVVDEAHSPQKSKETDKNKDGHDKEGAQPEPTFKCSRCPKMFVSKMQRMVHEKLHLQNNGFLQHKQTKLQEMTAKKFVIAPQPLGKNDSLLCNDCKVYFRTSRDLQEHQCTAGTKEEESNPDSRKCRCGKEFSGPSWATICRKCSKKNKKLRKKKKLEEGGEVNQTENLAKEEIREINGQRVKVIKVNNLSQLSDLKKVESPKPWAAPVPKSKRKSEETVARKQSRKRKHSEPVPEEFDPPEPTESIVRPPKVIFNCAFCSESFCFPNLLSQHSSEAHGKFYFCKFCILVMKTPEHEAIHDIECEKVKILPQKRVLKKFLFDLATLSCTKCNLSFATSSELLGHALAQHERRSAQEVKCCGKMFSKTAVVDHKVLIHKAASEVRADMIKETQEKCEVLNTFLHNLSIKQVQCDLCPFASFTDTAHARHLLQVHKICNG